MRIPPLPILGAAGAVLVLLTACGGSSPVSSPSANPSTSPSASASASAAPDPDPSPTVTVGDVAGLPACVGLQAVWQPGDSTAGHFHGTIQFANTGDAPCVAHGYAYVEPADDGGRLGSGSSRDDAHPLAAIRVDPGSGFVVSDVTITDADVLDCAKVPATALIVKLPDAQSTATLALDAPITACADGVSVVSASAVYVPPQS